MLGENIAKPLQVAASIDRIRPMDVGKTIKELRGKAGWSQHHLAEKANVEQTTISDIESGITGRPQAKTVAKIMAALRDELGPDFESDGLDAENALLRRTVMKLTLQLARKEEQYEEAIRELDRMPANVKVSDKPPEPVKSEPFVDGASHQASRE